VGRDSRPPGPAFLRLLGEHERGRRRAVAAEDLRADQAQPGQARRIPAAGVAPRGLRHHEPSARTKESDCALGRRGRRSEPPRHDQLDRPPPSGLPPRRFSPGDDDRDAVAQAELPTRLLEVLAAAAPRVEEHPLGRGPPQRQDQPGETPAGAEIEERTGGFEQGPQGLGVLRLLVDRPWSDESELLGAAQDGPETVLD